jgi:hypothetical protein
MTNNVAMTDFNGKFNRRTNNGDLNGDFENVVN